MNYVVKVVNCSYPSEGVIKLQELVNDEIGNGWVPLGGVCCTHCGPYFTLSQAMIRNPDNKLKFD